MLIDVNRSRVLIVDLQERLVPVIHGHEAIVASAIWLVTIAQKVGVPVAAVEQYAKGLGRTVKAVRDLLPEGAIGSKTHFSAVAAQCLPPLPGADRAQNVLIGIEAHVCLMQTALDLLEEGKVVYVVADAVGSRHEHDRDLALARLRQAGAQIVSREMVVFEWLREADTPLFRSISRGFLRG